MTPNLPIAALPIFGPDVSPDGQWGGVPWMHGVVHPEPLQGLRDRSVTTFGYAPGNAVLAVTNADNDLDGPPNDRTGWRVDPCGQAGTSLRVPGGGPCNSRTFPGVVISPALERLGIRLGDFCLVSYNGAVRSAQVYDTGPTRKQGEFALCLGRALGLVPPDWSDRQAALDGHDAEDVSTLFFAGSGPGHALTVDEIVARTHVLWQLFTGRAAEVSKGEPPAPPAPAAKAAAGRAASGSVGLAALLVLAAGALAIPVLGQFRLLAASPPPEIGSWLGCASFVITMILACLHIRRELRPDPPFDKKYATKEELHEIDKASQGRAKLNQERIDKVDSEHRREHASNTGHLEALDGKLDRNYEAMQARQDKFVGEVRHDVRVELQAAAVMAEARFEKQIDRFTDVVRGLGRVEGGRA